MDDLEKGLATQKRLAIWLDKQQQKLYKGKYTPTKEKARYDKLIDLGLRISKK